MEKQSINLLCRPATALTVPPSSLPPSPAGHTRHATRGRHKQSRIVCGRKRRSTKEAKRKASKVAGNEAVIDCQIPSNISLIVSVKIAGYSLG